MARPFINWEIALGAALLALALAGPDLLPAGAVVLNGHLEELEEGGESDWQKTQAKMQSPNGPGVKAGALTPNTFPPHFQGYWSCETTITESSIATILPGTKIQSELVFYPTADGRVEARFSQSGWVNNKCLAVAFNGNEAKADRTSYYFGEKIQGAWAARTRDQFLQENDNLITAKSYVDQYLDGQYLGRYRSVSILRRTAGVGSVASK